ncbi:ribonuclease III [Helicobacter didelphidarum]|uniref:ribonuclease III n=1 Tax=Helicobacter didelphidarum TaxID=2040648 RepID=UPI0015F12799|nr:ribonuclease III [Helicobacter didelphidarum]
MQQAQHIKFLEEDLNYIFKDRELLTEALTHKSFKKPYNNERLEFLGDAVLDIVVAEFLFMKFKNKKEGSLSKMRASLVNEVSFCKLANAIKLGNYLNLSVSEENNGGRLKPSILSNALEAVMAVIYLESGLLEVKKVFYPLMENEFHINEDSLLQDYKSALQEYTQEVFACIPTYELISQEGPDHNKYFVMQVKIQDKFYATAKGNSKKNAQQEAAKLTLKILKNEI